MTTCTIFYISSPADETLAGETQPFSSAIFNLNSRSRETERSDRARSNRDAINERRFRSIGLTRLNKRTAVVVTRLI